MTPTATVYFISLTANLPSGGYSENTSTHIGFVGINLIKAASPDFKNFGSSSITFPVLLSIFDIIFSNLHAICAVWQSNTGQYPFYIYPGWLIIITYAINETLSFAGSFYASEHIYPLFKSFTDTFLILNPTLSPGYAS